MMITVYTFLRRIYVHLIPGVCFIAVRVGCNEPQSVESEVVSLNWTRRG